MPIKKSSQFSNHIYIQRDAYEELNKWLNLKKKKTLVVEGARQVGKTFLIEKFCKDKFSKIYYIDLTSNKGRNLLRYIKDTERDLLNIVDYLTFLFKDFEDSDNNVLVIDEIQNSYTIYNWIRELTREFKINVIVTGSYLNMIMNSKDFRKPMGDIYTVQIKPLTFNEFLRAMNEDVYNKFLSIDLFGGSSKDEYEDIKKYFSVYLNTGGFPEVVEDMIINEDSSTTLRILNQIYEVYCMESSEYFDEPIYENIFITCTKNILRLLSKEKRGLKDNDLGTDLKKLEPKDSTMNISKKEYNKLINWLIGSKVLGVCDKCINCNPLDVIPNQRIFFNDVGLLTYLAKSINMPKDILYGTVCETYVYNYLKEQSYSTPSFATFDGYELDFLFINDNDEKYGIEVKHGKNIGISINKALNKGLINKALIIKGDTYGGNVGDKILTIPIYLLERFRF